MADQRKPKAALTLTWVARIFAAAIAVQVFLAGLALFVNSNNWTTHSYFARCFIFFPLVMIVLSFVGRLPIPYRMKSIQLFIMVVLMFVTASLSSHIGFLSALHPVIAVAMFWSAMTLSKQTAAQKGDA